MPVHQPEAGYNNQRASKKAFHNIQLSHGSPDRSSDGYTVKKSVLMPLNRSVSDVQVERTQWRERNLSNVLKKLGFLDESGVNIDLSRRYGHSIGQKRIVDHMPLNIPQCLTVLSSMRWDGPTTFMTCSGGTTGETFVAYLKTVLLPTLKVGDIVVMDNMRSHHVKAAEQTLLAAGMVPPYLPPYSPDLNPIEML